MPHGFVPSDHAVQDDRRRSTRTTTSPACTCAFPASRSWRPCSRPHLQDGNDPVTFQGLNPSGETAFGYTIPNLLIDHAMRNPHVTAGFWRGVNINHNAIYLECFMDELAHGGRQDPLEFRRKLMSKHPKNLAVLNAVAEKIGWGKPAPKGVYRGLAQMMAFGSYVAAAAEVSVTGNKIKIHRIVGGDRSGLRRQSGADRAAGRRLVRLRPVGIVLRRMHRQGRLHRADELRHLQFDAHRRDAEGGSDRHAVRRRLGRRRRADHLVAAPAVLNAYFAATGKRIRSFPLKNHNLAMRSRPWALIARRSHRTAIAAHTGAGPRPAPRLPHCPPTRPAVPRRAQARAVVDRSAAAFGGASVRAARLRQGRSAAHRA